MIQIQHLTITHTKDLRELVHDLNLTIATGEKVAIMGKKAMESQVSLPFLSILKHILTIFLTRELLTKQIAHRSIFPSRFRIACNL